MRNKLLLGLFAFFSVAALHAQTLGVQLKYSASAEDSKQAGTVQVYRADGSSCSALSNFSEIYSQAAPGGPYVDATVTLGATYSYYVKATVPGYNGQSDPSNCVTVLIAYSTKPSPPGGLTATVVVVNQDGSVKPAIIKPRAPEVQ